MNSCGRFRSNHIQLSFSSGSAILLKDGCVDDPNEDCQNRANEGVCESNPNEMVHKCGKSCKIDRWDYADFPSEGECD